MKLKNYIVVDIENPNSKANSICSISLVKVENNKIVDTVSALINPEDTFDPINIKINKITPEMVIDKMTFDKFWNEYKDYFENNIVIGHGIKYDLSVITKSLRKYDIDPPLFKMICTQKLAQKYLDVEKCSLNKICEYLNINLDEHHNSLCDTLASYEIFKYINNNFQIENVIEDYQYLENKSSSSGMKIVYTDATKSLQVLKKIIEDIMSDNIIEMEEILQLKEWLDSNEQLIGNYPFDKISEIVKNVLEDGIVTRDEYHDLMHTFNDFINPLEEEKSDNKVIFNEKMFCLTGTFNSGSKEEIEKKIITKGGIVGKGVTSKTNYLIVGGSGSDAWKFGNYGGKVQKAMQLKEKGQDIEIIGEEDFLKNL